MTLGWTIFACIATFFAAYIVFAIGFYTSMGIQQRSRLLHAYMLSAWVWLPGSGMVGIILGIINYQNAADSSGYWIFTLPLIALAVYFAGFVLLSKEP